MGSPYELSSPEVADMTQQEMEGDLQLMKKNIITNLQNMSCHQFYRIYGIIIIESVKGLNLNIDNLFQLGFGK